MDRIERVQCVLEGRLPDRPPVSFWHHLDPDQFCGRAAVDAHVAHVDAYPYPDAHFDSFTHIRNEHTCALT